MTFSRLEQIFHYILKFFENGYFFENYSVTFMKNYIKNRFIKYSKHVILISLTNLKSKIGNIYDKVNWYLLNDSLNNDLATITVYTENKSPEEITDEIIELINERKHIM